MSDLAKGCAEALLAILVLAGFGLAWAGVESLETSPERRAGVTTYQPANDEAISGRPYSRPRTEGTGELGELGKLGESRTLRDGQSTRPALGLHVQVPQNTSWSIQLAALSSLPDASAAPHAVTLRSERARR